MLAVNLGAVGFGAEKGAGGRVAEVGEISDGGIEEEIAFGGAPGRGSSGGEEANASQGLPTVGFEGERRLIGGVGSREEGRGEGLESQEETRDDGEKVASRNLSGGD